MFHYTPSVASRLSIALFTATSPALPGYEARGWNGILAPAEFDAVIRTDVAKWAKVIKEAGIRAQ